MKNNQWNTEHIEDQSGRVAIVTGSSSDIHWRSRKYKKWDAYRDSKIANLYFTHGLSSRPANGSPVVAAAHPGWTVTDLQRHSPLTSVMNQVFAQTPSMGALPTFYAALAPDVENSDYFGPGGFMEFKGHPKKTRSSTQSRDMRTADKLWRLSEELTGVHFFTRQHDKEEI